MKLVLPQQGELVQRDRDQWNLALFHSRRRFGRELKQQLAAWGYDVSLFRSAGRLLSWLGANPVEVVLVHITNDSNGAKTVARIRERFPMLPILALADECDSATLGQAIRYGANHFVIDAHDNNVLSGTIERLVNFKMEHLRYTKVMPYIHTRFQASIPSQLELLGGMVFYLTEEMFKHGIINLNQINVKIALVEALTNAMEHGNGLDEKKQVHIEAEFNYDEARIDIVDEGSGFDIDGLPDPTTEKNLFRPRGRGIYMMRQFLDEVTFSPPGNQITLVKRRAAVAAMPRPYPWERRMV